MTKQNKARGKRLDVSRYRGEWLALHPDTHRIIAHDVSLNRAKAAAVRQGIRSPLLYAVPKSDAYFVGGC
jgi:hypothetical protein